MAIWERIWRANCAVAVFGGHAGTRTHGACKPGCGMGTPLRKATAQKRAPRIFPHGKQTGPGSAPRHGIGGGLRAGRAAAVRRATPHPYFSITVERTGRGGQTERVRARLHKRPLGVRMAAFAPDAASPTDAMAAGLLSPIPLADIVLWEAIVRAGKRKGAGASARAA